MTDQDIDEELENELELIRAMYPDRELSAVTDKDSATKIREYKIELEPNT